MCDFSSGFTAPEMIKNRPVVVVSPRRKNYSGLCTIVAISTAAPNPIENWHFQLPKSSMPKIAYFQSDDSWIKGDMICRVSFARLNLIQVGKEPGTGKRLYFKEVLDPNLMKEVHSCVLQSLNLGHLQPHL